MRDSWKQVQLGELVTIQKGKISEQSDYPFTGYAPIINTDVLRGDIKVWGKITGSVLCDENNVLILWDGERSGLCAIGFNGVLGSTFSKMNVSNDLEPQYLYRFIDFNFDWIQGQRTGTGVPHVPKDLKTIFKVDFPPLPQQQKIAKILSTVDAVIEQTQTAIAKYQAIKQGLMHDLFTRGIDVITGKLRPTPQEAPELYKESVLGLIPVDWDEGQFIDFADEHISHSFTGGPFGSDLQTKHYTKEGVRIIQLQNIGDGHFKNAYKIFTSEERANYLRACNIYPGDIILSKMAEPIARACIIPPFHERYLMASDGIRLSINKKKFNLRFVLETINQKRFRNIAEIRATGTTRSRIGLTELKEIPVCYPNRKEQNLIGKKLDDLEENISIEQQALAKYQQLKAGLMEDLLTGKVAVSLDKKE